MNKRKIINDPVYGFITIPFELIFDIMEHPWFQRLRRIQQLGLSNLVYPGAIHSRLNHALGAVHLMGKTLQVLRAKGHSITTEEAEAVSVAILLHDIGHGPFSHALEKTLIRGIGHEELSAHFMQRLNTEFGGRLELAMHIFNGTYEKKFLHQLVSSQLDIDRLDYLVRDSYFTGVHEGVIGYDRLIEMMDVDGDQIVIEHKGIYSVEKFIIARRVMYWQVYLHKTVLCAEQMLIKTLQRARQLAQAGYAVPATEALARFLKSDPLPEDFHADPELLSCFADLDDSDVYTALKSWRRGGDEILAFLSSSLLNRKLFRIELEPSAFSPAYLESIEKRILSKYPIRSRDDMRYYLFGDITSNSAYDLGSDNIHIKFRSGRIVDVAEASDNLNLTALAETVVKHYICYPKDI